MHDFNKFEVITFDCYGTLIDWESGIIDTLRPVFNKHKIKLSDVEILELYAELEAPAENSEYMNYRNVLKTVMRSITEKFGFAPALNALDVLSESIKHWKPFPDTVDALRRMSDKYKLAIISNIDDDLFTYTAQHLEVPFDWIITAEMAKSYKPSLNNFYYAFQKMDIPVENILHVSQSFYHDIIPAKQLGLANVHINRLNSISEYGATLPAQTEPDMTVSDLKELAEKMGL